MGQDSDAASRLIESWRRGDEQEQKETFQALGQTMDNDTNEAINYLANRMDENFKTVFRKLDKLTEVRAACELQHDRRLTRLEQIYKLWPFALAAVVGVVGFLAKVWAGGR